MKTLFVDIETRSKVDLKSCGAYRYAEEAELLLLGYAYDTDPVAVIDVINNQQIPVNVIVDLWDPEILKVAHNANFERTLLRRHFGYDRHLLPPQQWLCTAAWGAYAGLPRSLDSACQVAGIAGKLLGGKALITKFCTKHKPCCGEDWKSFKAYNRQDVEVERELYKWLHQYPMPAKEWDLWCMDQEINDRGFRIDVPFVKACIDISETHRAVLAKEATAISGIANPNSVAQLKKYLGENVKTLNKAAVAEMLAKGATGVTRRLLEIRQSLALSSVKKYQALANAVCQDGRVRGTMLYYGAHTGRWSGRLFQPQNLPRIKPVDPETAHMMILKKDAEDIELFYGDIEACLSSMIRTAIIAPKDGFLRVDDYSAIEARVCAWLAGEEWILGVFRRDEPYYEATAAKMYHLDPAAITKELRQKGKTAALSLQYQGSVGALQRMGVESMNEEEMLELVRAWRAACPAIVAYWGRLNNAALDAVRGAGPQKVGLLTFRVKNHDMFIDLPAGRALIYRNFEVTESSKTGEPAVAYDWEEKGKVLRKQLYGGLLCENVVQSIARDILAEHLLDCKDVCVLHVHDEVVLENKEIPLRIPSWCEGLPLKIAGFTSTYYKKE